ncbi:MAG: hypothetical protein ABI895_12245 [Deltaproteobacteria bacterium]
MFNPLAALGLGLVAAVTASSAPALACDRVQPSSGYPSYGPSVPTYLPAPPRVQAPPVYRDVGYTTVLSRADYDYDGGITLAEAHAYGRAQFASDDLDRNGVLTRHELRRTNDELARGANDRGGVVTFAEYDANVQREFYRLDVNRDGFLSRYELGTEAPRTASVGWSWHWSL